MPMMNFVPRYDLESEPLPSRGKKIKNSFELANESSDATSVPGVLFQSLVKVVEPKKNNLAE
jgi:hypothetical protein